MANDRLLDPVTATDVPKVDDAIAVGEDLKFQEKWWTFERAAWSFFVLVLIADVLGMFGSGWLANATIAQPGSAMVVKYERVERSGTPSKMQIQFDPDAAANGKLVVFVSDTVLKGLGAQRVIPQPETSTVLKDGVLYTFSAGTTPGEIGFEMQPSAPGVHWFHIQVQGKSMVSARVVVMP